MHEMTFAIPGYGASTQHSLTLLSFGNPDARPHIHIQGGLHADEAPGMLVARLVADRLARLERSGALKGRVTVLPAANPIGLAQFVHGDQTGRFDLYDGRNFNRDYPDLAPAAAERLAGRLGADPAVNMILVRTALLQALADRTPIAPADVLRATLLRLALPADVVLDLHCDGEATVHLYTQAASLERILPLAALTGCRAVLLADVSGGEPFDEALVRPWLDLAARFPDHPIPCGCASTTLELRGRVDVDRRQAGADADALIAYLVHAGAVAGTTTLPPPACAPTPLAGSEALIAPVAGLLSYVASLGDEIAAGQTLAEITDLGTGAVTPVRATTAGVFFARPATRIAEPGKRIGKIAGSTPFREGALLSP
ncbi:succinylglutamate desuccinylase/aspartoacylase family protein [Pannonibacter tanglangensis]|uniref:Deacylase n=1 Tax=Pannonibacter tanglangensis TaxID=2750084 RepID=A0ABW9ZGR9_9HYPH|nr:M14 family metallopeptidase [Pannonibacter sp. XCT-34]NBN63142.1 deacylase [Pannonibacter sp. XCT-34]